VHWSIAAAVPVTYLLNTRDRPVTPEAQEKMVTHLPRAPRVVRLDTGHIPAVTDPEGFARRLDE
jgi:pimeloyl-ACP methyl ester carboxylesterase